MVNFSIVKCSLVLAYRQIQKTKSPKLIVSLLPVLPGKCEERFDTVFDWVRPNRDENGYMTGVIYNTFFFADGRYWMYENSKGRTRYGDPLLIRGGWQGIASRQIDGILHVWSRTWDVLFFFAGTSVMQITTTINVNEMKHQHVLLEYCTF